MIEIQVHPGSIRKKVKYYFLKKKFVIWLGIAASLTVLFLTWSILIAPGGFTSHQTRLDFSNALSQRTRLLTRANNMTRHAEELSEALDEQRRILEKFYTIYNINLDSKGQGGLEEVTVPASSSGFNRMDALGERLKQQVVVSEKLLEELSAYESENRAVVSITPTICPIPKETFVLTSPFGKRINPFTKKSDFHQGLDFSAPVGTPLVAAADGRVSFSGRYPLRKSAAWWRYGNIVVLTHGKSFISIYAHLDKVHVKKGKKVTRGQLIGEVGNTGWSTSSHLHYEIRSILVNGSTFVPVDPRIYILDHKWSNMDRILIAARGNNRSNFEPIPSIFRR